MRIEGAGSVLCGSQFPVVPESSAFYNCTMKTLLNIFLISLMGGLFFSSASAAGSAVALGEKLDAMGTFLEREDGGFINIRIVDNKFQLYFTDEEKLVIPADFAKAYVRYASHVKRSDRDRTVTLKPDGNGAFLTASRAILPPHYYRVRIILTDEAEESESSGIPTYGSRTEEARKETFPEVRLKQIGTSK